MLETHPRSVARLATLIVSSVLTVLSAPGVVDGDGTCWRPPVVGPVVDHFRAPTCPYCAGNRGLEYRVAPSTTVVAVASGRVSWAGAVAGIRWVVVRHANGMQTSYGHLDSTGLRRGDAVVAGAVIGTVGGEFHFGVRLGGRYLDPATVLGRPVTRPRLVPTDGSPPRPAPPSAWRCDRTTAGRWFPEGVSVARGPTPR